ncbi:LAFA_0G13740g1_1 [Lachancea sp. 'fantastica']|nr:LAFA_0G13740g1_1 [Lachancea sp. 'fantastica']
MVERALTLDQAHDLIASLEKQLEELESTSHDYEQELERYIQKLQTDLKEKDESIVLLKQGEENRETRERITVLEIQTDELEQENRVLRSQLRESKSENDRLMELNVLLEHELTDLRSMKSTDKHRTSSHHSCETALEVPKFLSPKKRHSNPIDFLKVSTDQSSLRLSSHSTTGDVRATHVSSTKVVATTRHK